MNILQAIEGFSRSLILIGVETILLVLLFVLAATIARFIFGRIGTIPILRKHLDRSERVQNRIRGMLIFLCILSCTAILGYNGFLLYRQIDVYQHTVSLLTKIPADFWSQLVSRLAKAIGLAVFAHYAIKLLLRLLSTVENRVKTYEHLKSNDESITGFLQSFASYQKTAYGSWLFFMQLMPCFCLQQSSMLCLFA